MSETASREEFHEQVVEAIATARSCFKERSARECMLDKKKEVRWKTVRIANN